MYDYRSVAVEKKIGLGPKQAYIDSNGPLTETDQSTLDQYRMKEKELRDKGYQR